MSALNAVNDVTDPYSNPSNHQYPTTKLLMIENPHEAALGTEQTNSVLSLLDLRSGTRLSRVESPNPCLGTPNDPGMRAIVQIPGGIILGVFGRGAVGFFRLEDAGSPDVLDSMEMVGVNGEGLDECLMKFGRSGRGVVFDDGPLFCPSHGGFGEELGFLHIPTVRPVRMGTDIEILVFDVRWGEKSAGVPIELCLVGRFSGNRGRVECLDVFPGNCEYLFSGGWDCTFRKWNYERGSCEVRRGHAGGFVNALSHSWEHEVMITAGNDSSIVFWDPHSMVETHRLPTKAGVTAMLYRSPSHELVTSDLSGLTTILDLRFLPGSVDHQKPRVVNQLTSAGTGFARHCLGVVNPDLLGFFSIDSAEMRTLEGEKLWSLETNRSWIIPCRHETDMETLRLDEAERLAFISDLHGDSAWVQIRTIAVILLIWDQWLLS